MKKFKVLVLDIETAPILAYVWQLKDQYVGIDQVVKDWFIMAWSAKWLEKSNSHVYYDTRNSGQNDKAIMNPLWKLLNEADIVLTQNGKAFDEKKIRARMMLQGFKPYKPVKHLDTYLIAKQAGFTSHSLEYLTERFCKKYKKLKHTKFPGLELWKECLKSNVAAWNEMKKYNKHDVLSTEELYLAIRAWAPDLMPKVFALTDSSSECGTCGYVGKMREGEPRRTRRYEYTQHSCPKCGSWQAAGKIVKK